MFCSVISSICLLAGILSLLGSEPPKTIASARVMDPSPGVKLVGVVTWAGLGGNSFTMQDATGAIWVNRQSSSVPILGQVVEVEGALRKGGVGNLIEATVIRVIGNASLPPPIRLEGAMLYAPNYDCRRVEVMGILRAVAAWPAPGADSTMLYFASGGLRVRVLMPTAEGAKFSGLIDAEVTFSGISANTVNDARQTVNILIRSNGWQDFQVTRPPQVAEELGVTPVERLLVFPSGGVPGHRVKTRGTVTAMRFREWVQIQSGAQGVRVLTLGLDENLPRIGDFVEVLGFPVPGRLSPVLEDGQFVILGKPEGPPEPLRVASTADAMAHDGRLIQIRAKLVKARTEVAPARLLLDQGGDLFEAEFPSALSPGALDAEEGAVLDLRGVCEISVGSEWLDVGFPTARGFVLRLGSVADVKEVKKAPWWTPVRLGMGLAVACGACLMAIASVSLIVGKNRRLRHAELELRGARDALARRVETRTDQLQEQLAARRDESSQYAVVTAERVRVARDLHDSLEQTLAGTALRIEAARELLPEHAEATRSQLVRAEELLRRSQSEVRRTVWGLRSLALEKQSFAEALRESIHLLTDETGLKTEVEVADGIYGLAAGTEGNLLRIAQEAVANVLKHSGARRLTIFYGINEQGRLVLKVADDGQGFSLPAVEARPQAHFGLTGMRERAVAMGGVLTIQGRPGKGTCIAISLPQPQINPASSETISAQ